MAELSIEERVANGVKWLDENRPGWLVVVDLDRLSMRSTCNCVLGQLYGNFWDAPKDAHGDDGEALGFESINSPIGFRADFELLGAEWKRVITARREVSDASS